MPTPSPSPSPSPTPHAYRDPPAPPGIRSTPHAHAYDGGVQEYRTGVVGRGKGRSLDARMQVSSVHGMDERPGM
jgi:hypothetical protein